MFHWLRWLGHWQPLKDAFLTCVFSVRRSGAFDRSPIWFANLWLFCWLCVLTTHTACILRRDGANCCTTWVVLIQVLSGTKLPKSTILATKRSPIMIVCPLWNKCWWHVLFSLCLLRNEQKCAICLTGSKSGIDPVDFAYGNVWTDGFSCFESRVRTDISNSSILFFND